MAAKCCHGWWDRFAHQERTILEKKKFELFLGRSNSARIVPGLSWSSDKVDPESGQDPNLLYPRA